MRPKYCYGLTNIFGPLAFLWFAFKRYAFVLLTLIYKTHYQQSETLSLAVNSPELMEKASVNWCLHDEVPSLMVLLALLNTLSRIFCLNYNFYLIVNLILFYLEFFTFFNPNSCCDNFTQLCTTSNCNALLISQLTVISDVYLWVNMGIIVIIIFLKEISFLETCQTETSDLPLTFLGSPREK